MICRLFVFGSWIKTDQNAPNSGEQFGEQQKLIKKLLTRIRVTNLKSTYSIIEHVDFDSL
jgi:hypothetical protein